MSEELSLEEINEPTIVDPCDLCDGTGHDPRPPDDRVCPRCQGRLKYPGRPALWPAVGVTLGRVDSLDTFEVLEGERFGMIRIRAGDDGSERAIDPRDYVAGTYYNLQEA